MAEGADLLDVGRMIIDLDPVVVEHGFERKQFSVTDNGSVQMVTLKVFRDLAGGQQTSMDLNGEGGANA